MRGQDAQPLLLSAAWDVWKTQSLQVRVLVLSLAHALELCVFEKPQLEGATKQPQVLLEQRHQGILMNWLLVWRTHG